jgi:DNA-3-methyladenine glycosylase
MAVLPRSFYARPTLLVARDLLGHELLFDGPAGRLGGRIVEVEAYLGEADPASHAHRGPTPRNRVMFGPPGHAYVYLSYGMHHCVNVVCEGAGQAGAVLIRALEPRSNLELWRTRRPDLALARAASGPGRVCRALGLARVHDGLDLTRPPLTIRRCAEPRGPLAAGPRVGLSRAVAAPFRFWLADSPAVSSARGSAPGPWPARRSGVDMPAGRP